MGRTERGAAVLALCVAAAAAAAAGTDVVQQLDAESRRRHVELKTQQAMQRARAGAGRDAASLRAREQREQRQLLQLQQLQQRELQGASQAPPRPGGNETALCRQVRDQDFALQRYRMRAFTSR